MARTIGLAVPRTDPSSDCPESAGSDCPEVPAAIAPSGRGGCGTKSRNPSRSPRRSVQGGRPQRCDPAWLV